jgi:flagellar motor switch protein FliN/FliY
MSDGSLSQDEIDALLAGTSDIDIGDSAGGASSTASGDSLVGLQTALAETVQQQQSNMSMITGKTVEVAPPTVNGGTPAGLSGQVVRIEHNFGAQGGHVYILSSEDAIKFASASMGLDGVELDEAALNAVQEVFSQVAGPVINTLSEKTGTTIMPDPAHASVVDASDMRLPSDSSYARYTVTFDGSDTAIVYEVFESSFATQLPGGAPHAGPSAAPQQPAGSMGNVMGGGAPAGGGYQQPMQNAGMGGQMMQGMGNQMMPGMGGGPNVQAVQFANLQPSYSGSEQGNIGLLMDVQMEMTVELGRTRKFIKDILGMGEGTIIELDKLAGEPVDILVNHKLIAKGEVVVIDENFGVRVTEIVSPAERLSDVT